MIDFENIVFIIIWIIVGVIWAYTIYNFAYGGKSKEQDKEEKECEKHHDKSKTDD